MTYRNHAEEIASAIAADNVRKGLADPLPSQFYVEHFRGPFATAPRKRKTLGGYPWLTFAAAVLAFILATGLLMIAATHVTHRTALTVGQAHVKAMH